MSAAISGTVSTESFWKPAIDVSFIIVSLLSFLTGSSYPANRDSATHVPSSQSGYSICLTGWTTMDGRRGFLRASLCLVRSFSARPAAVVEVGGGGAKRERDYVWRGVASTQSGVNRPPLPGSQPSPCRTLYVPRRTSPPSNLPSWPGDARRAMA
eukprot:CAMPEP_0172078860 /NCGR_PEP_ID=MMETSP1043-20130122/17855_1 /TAXON_ID=464988 /ORGANISM="Hemiselmis andersenii, Strain CCMP441" /LENGTH=154 /DNA_ID=CAMNT_0012739985 /DNA_START=120 /DNA_END=585 /DNA_ORIENTATION=-